MWKVRACADVAIDMDMYVLLLVSCLPCKSTGSKCAQREFVPVMG